MRFASIAAASIALGAGLVTASPVTRQTTSLSPCANITQQFASRPKNATTSFVVSGELAYDCLMSIPFNSELGSAYVLETTKYLQFQSTIPILKNPPKSYLSPAVDLLGGMTEIYQKANSSQYQSQYQLDTEMSDLLYSANDGHLNAGFCTSSIFAFGIQYSIYSISTDGIQVPSLYLSTDVRAASTSNGTAEVSDIVQINGQNATQYIEKLGLTTQNQDPDAQYNNVFPSPAKAPLDEGGSSGAFTSNNGRWPDSSSMSLTFRNGSMKNIPILASLNSVQFNYTSGEDLYAAYCLPVDTTSTSSSSNTTSTATVSPTATAAPPAYPNPVVRDPYNNILGYYINETGFNDTSVLFVPSFEVIGTGLPDDEAATFAYVASTFVNESRAAGKTKMIIDVSGNAGGTITAGFDLFKLFFPDLAVYTATRMRDHDAQRLMMEILATVNATEYSDFLSENSFYYAEQVTPDQQSDFGSWEQLYGPDNINGANMTSLYANFNFTSSSTLEEPIRGYGGVPTNETGRPFAAEDIVIVSDGYCQSTCTTFVNLMTTLGGVKSIGMGGRPINAPMQAIGGVRGAQSLAWPSLYEYAGAAYEFAYNSSKTNTPILTQDDFDLLEATLPIDLEDFPLQITADATNLNLRDAYDPGNDEIPLQFAYQPANCKLFYTFANLIEPKSIWTSAASAIWGNGTCVPGSVTNGTIAFG